MSVSVILPAGTYYLGDITFVLPEETCHSPELWTFASTISPLGIFGALGSDVVYEVVSGIVGLVPFLLFREDCDLGSGSLHTFLHPVHFYADDQMINIESGETCITLDITC